MTSSFADDDHTRLPHGTCGSFAAGLRSHHGLGGQFVLHRLWRAHRERPPLAALSSATALDSVRALWGVARGFPSLCSRFPQLDHVGLAAHPRRRSAGVKEVINALFGSMLSIANVLAVIVMVWLMFAILGVQLFAGKFKYCSDPSFPPGAPFAGLLAENGSELSPPCVRSAVDPASGHGVMYEVVDAAPNFDNVLEAFQTIFIMTSGESWPSFMFQSMDIVDAGRQPERGASAWNAFYFIAFVIVSVFFLLNLFISVIFENYIRLKRQESKVKVKTARQREWVDTQRVLDRLQPKRAIPVPEHPLRRRVQALIHTGTFSAFIVACVALNVAGQVRRRENAPIWFSEQGRSNVPLTFPLYALFSTEQAALFYRAPDWWINTIELSNVVFAFVFVLEAVAKMAGDGFWVYMSDKCVLLSKVGTGFLARCSE